MRSGVFVVAFALLTPLLAGCGQDGSWEESGSKEQYEGGEPTAPAQAAGTGFSEDACLEAAAESGEAGVEISNPGEVPSYEVSGESEMETGKELEVVTEATSREDLKAVTEDLRFENQGQ